MDSLPFLVLASSPRTPLEAHLGETRAEWETALLTHGAVLFRGFADVTAATFERLAGPFYGEALDYTYRSTPRTEVGKAVYTATEYPAPLTIPQHSENAYQRQWPARLAFFCEISAEEGGQTPLSDNRETTARLPAELRARFEERGVLYVRNFGHGVDLPWEVAFQTSDRAEVERYCDRHGIAWEWLDGNRLRTRQVCQALAAHPVTGERFWFNQAHLFHVSALDPKSRRAMESMFRREDLPRNAYYGDGSELEEDVLETVRAAYSNTVAFDWKAGDVLLVDNLRVAHGRRPFRGKRRILVSMGKLSSASGPEAGR